MCDKNFLASKKLSKIDLNQPFNAVELQSYWCRVVYSKYEVYNAKEHRHCFWELHMCLSGSCEIDATGKKCILTEKHFLLLPPETPHRIVCESADFSKLIWGFSVDDAVVDEQLREAYALPASYETDKNMNSVPMLLEEAVSQHYGFYGILKGLLYGIFIGLVRRVNGIQTSDKHLKKDSDLMHSIKQYVINHPACSDTTEDIAAMFFLSKSTLERICRSECGTSFSRLKSSLRAQYICRLLANTELSIDKIASLAGFSDRYSLGKFFKKQEGMPPMQYRKSLRK